MASSDVFVTFGGDTAALEAACVVAKTQIQQLTREMQTAAREFNKTGGAADSELGQKLKGLGAQVAATKSRLSELRAIQPNFAPAANSAEAFKKQLDRIGEFAWNNTNLSGGDIDRVINPLKGMVGVLGVAGTVGVASGLAVGGAFAYLQYRAYEAEVAVKSVSAAMSWSGQNNALGGFGGLQSIMQQATQVQGAWDLIGKGAALSNEEAQKFATELAGVQGLTGRMAQAFTDLAREERYAFGQEGLAALQGFVAALKQPETALQTLITQNAGLTAAQRQQAQSALASGSAQKQASTYFDLVTQDLIRQKTESALTEVAHSKLSVATRQLAEEAIATARSGGDLEAVLQKLSAAGVKAAGDLYRVVSSIRTNSRRTGQGLRLRFRRRAAERRRQARSAVEEGARNRFGLEPVETAGVRPVGVGRGFGAARDRAQHDHRTRRRRDEGAAQRQSRRIRLDLHLDPDRRAQGRRADRRRQRGAGAPARPAHAGAGRRTDEPPRQPRRRRRAPRPDRT